jgi:hypothetical protein
VYNFLNNEERSSTKLILHNGDLSAADDKNRITYGQTVLSSNGDISVTVDFARQEAQTTKNNLEHAMGKDELEEPPSKQEVVREELSHAVDARTDPKGYLQAAAADKTFQGKRDDKPSEKRRIAIENSSPMQERTSKAQVKDGEAAVKPIKNIVDYEKYKFKN